MKSDIHFKRRYKFGLSVTFPGTEIAEFPVTIENRPSLNLVEKENRDGSFTIEKQAWSPLVTSIFDEGVEPSPIFADIYKLLGKFYDFGAYLFKTDNPSEELEKIKDSLGTGKVVVYSLKGVPLEEWTFTGMWPHSVNFGDLCYSSSSEIEIQITWRYKGCSVTKLEEVVPT